MSSRKTINIGRVKGSMVYSGTDFQVDNPLEGDLYLHSEEYNFYQYHKNEWVLAASLEEHSLETEGIKIATSENYNLESEEEIPTSKAIMKIINENANGDFNLKNGEGESSIVMMIPEGEGYYPNTASATRSFAIGHGAIASGKNSFSSGANTIASHYNAHAEGLETEANTYNAHAEGAWTVASGQSAHAEGNGYATGTTIDTIVQKTIASGLASHAEGQGTQASGTGAHSEGYLTIASQKAAHAEGGETKATRGYSHAGGYGSEANGARSFVHGNYVKAEQNDQFVVGTYNQNKANTIFEVGYGTGETNRRNAFEILNDGRVKAGAEPVESDDLATKIYIDKKIGNISAGGIKMAQIQGVYENGVYKFQERRLDVDYARNIRVKVYEKDTKEVFTDFIFAFSLDLQKQEYQYRTFPLAGENVWDSLSMMTLINYAYISTGEGFFLEEEEFTMDFDIRDQGDYILELYYYEGNDLSIPVYIDF